MQALIVFALVGFGTPLVDGALGMAYGVTSTSTGSSCAATGRSARTATRRCAEQTSRPACSE